MKIVMFLVAVCAFILGPVLWTDAPGMMPSSSQLPFFIFLTIVESVLFGAGVVFVLYGWPMVQRLSGKDGEKKLIFFSIAWLLISWWPHDNLHRHNGLDLQGLLYIEYAFHLTLIITSCIIAWQFWKSLPIPSEIVNKR